MFDFPSSPVNNQQYKAPSGQTYVFNGVAWLLSSGPPSTGVVTGDNPPPAPVPGMLWFQSSTGNTYIWYVDVDSAAWVQFNVAPPLAPETGLYKRVLLQDLNIAAQASFSFDYFSGWPSQYDNFIVEISNLTVTTAGYLGFRVKTGTGTIVNTTGYGWTQSLHTHDGQITADGHTTTNSTTNGFNTLVPLTRAGAAAYIAAGAAIGRNAVKLEFPNPTKQSLIATNNDFPWLWTATNWGANSIFARIQGAAYYNGVAPVTGLYLFGSAAVTCRAKLWGERTL